MIQRLTLLTLLLTCTAFPLFASAASTNNTPRIAPPQYVPEDTSGNDAWGYTWVRSDSGGPAYNWIDITTVGTQVVGLGDDNNVGPFSIGFDFQYYWYTVSQFRIGSNGYITFGNQTSNFAAPFAVFPTVTVPNDMVCPLGGDLDFTVPAANSRCYYWANGIDSVVVSWIDVTEWQQTPNADFKHTFQLIISGQDSSLTFQYGVQQGTFSGVNNNVLTIGIENSTGSIGLNYAYEATTPHPRLPFDGLAVKIQRTVNTGLQVTDAGMVGGLNDENQGEFFRVNEADTVHAVVRNYGTIDLTGVRVVYAITKTGQPTARDTVFLDMLAGEEATITFPRLFTPAVAGSYSAAFTSFVAGDQGALNNTATAEIRSVNLSETANARLSFEDRSIGGSIGWLGGGGFAVDFEVPAEQVRIESVFVSVGTITNPSMTVEILDGAGGFPGTVLATKTLSAITGINAISFRDDSIRITNGRFFVGARGEMNFDYEITPPIAYRTWEYTNGYAPYRSRDVQDMIIQVSVREEEAIPPDPNTFMDDFEAYTAGVQLVSQNNTDWDTWSSLPGSSEDPFVSDAFAYSGSNSVLIVTPNDLIRYHGQRTTGSWGISFQVYIPSGKQGYFNTMSGFTPNPLYWAMEVYLDPAGAGRLLTGDPEVGFTWIEDTWQLVEVIVDLDQNLAQFFFNGDIIHQWTWTLGASGGTGPLRLDANDFFGAEANDEMYFDDYHFMADTLRSTSDINDPVTGIPVEYNLGQNYPNPFNPSTRITYALPEQASVTLRIYNLLGQEVITLADKVEEAGYHEVVWNARNSDGHSVGTGVYFYRLEARGTSGEVYTDFRKMIFLK